MNRLKRFERPLRDTHFWCYPGVVFREDGGATTRTKPERPNQFDRIEDMIVVHGVLIVIAAHETIVA
jgi:hypothetical protein